MLLFLGTLRKGLDVGMALELRIKWFLHYLMFLGYVVLEVTINTWS
jgi:hypothetical protein